MQGQVIGQSKMAEQTDKYILDKSIWTHEYFEQMGLHGSIIYGLKSKKVKTTGHQILYWILTIFSNGLNLFHV